MADGKRRRTIKVDRRVQARINGEHKREAAKAKEVALDDANEAPIPDDGLDHERWPAEARKLALLMLDPSNMGLTQTQLGEMCGYSLRSVQRYQSMPSFKAYVNSIADRMYSDDAHALFVRAMMKGLDRGDPKFVELYMKSKGMLKNVNQNVSDVNINDTRRKNDDDDLAEIERLRREAGLDGEVTH